MINIEEIELHDALLKSVSCDCVAATVQIALEFYELNASVRRGLTLLFSGVDAFTQMLSMERMKINSFAGTVNYWIPEQNGTTYIYLSDGCIMIAAERISVVSD